MTSWKDVQKSRNEKIEEFKKRYPGVREEIISEKYADLINMDKIHEKCRECVNCDNETCTNGYEGLYPRAIVEGEILDIVWTTCKKENARRKQKKYDNKLKFSKIPRRYRGKTFSDYESNENNEVAIDVANDVIDGKALGMYLFGGVGTGKTLLSAIVAQQIMVNDNTVLFASVPDMLNDLKAGIETNSVNEILQSLMEVDLLVLDDIGSENITPWASEQIFTIINDRSSNEKGLIVTSNYDPKSLMKRLVPVDKMGEVVDTKQGQRIVSRILEICEPVKLDGMDYRMKRQ